MVTTRRCTEKAGRLEQTIQTISDGKNKINKLVEQLLEKNKLTKEEMEKILS